MAAPAEAVQLSSANFSVFRAFLSMYIVCCGCTLHTNVHDVVRYTAYAPGAPRAAAEKLRASERTVEVYRIQYRAGRTFHGVGGVLCDAPRSGGH